MTNMPDLPSPPSDWVQAGSPLLLTLSRYPAPDIDPVHRLPKGLPVNPTTAQVAYARRLYTQSVAILGVNPRDGQGDVEDYWEQAARLDAALHCGAPRVLIEERLSDQANPRVRKHVTRDITLGVPGEGRVPQMDAEMARGCVMEGPSGSSYTMVHYGPISEGSSLWARVGRVADLYADSEVFTRHAGRRVAVVGFNVDIDDHTGEPSAHEDGTTCDIDAVMAHWAREGVDEVVVKVRRAKHGIWRVPTHLDRNVNRSTLSDALGWSLVHNEGLHGAYLLQSVVEMAYEYRFFMVDGRPVTGAGCIEEYTPLYAQPSSGPFSPYVRRCRGVDLTGGEDAVAEAEFGAPVPPGDSASPIVADEVLVGQLVAFARQVGAEFKAEGMMPRAYTLDVALNPSTGEPVIIETNGMSNSGLYASQPWLVTHALLTPAVDMMYAAT